ncbi:IS66 family insertion sequence element accessory protein TnpB [Xanthomonas citri]|uniref:IS66 family insertion sequence element accessory protein TnpB n=1 Tax=Xanthomonas citri TaxID=346 RepID=UPI0009B6896B|nr:IS66 family insertion sequence element accessory protein TnpB [Xanthomonas citri]
MDAINLITRISIGQLSSYPKPFKAQVVQECLQPGATVSSVAISHGINVNVIRKWMPLYRNQPATIPAFVPLKAAPKRPAEASVIIELPMRPSDHSEMANLRPRGLRAIYPGCGSMIRIEAIWLATEPMDMRAGTETALARMIAVFDAAKPHCAYLFANRRANRMKVLVHDGVGVWLTARRLNQGKFHWPGIRHGCEVELDSE